MNIAHRNNAQITFVYFHRPGQIILVCFLGFELENIMQQNMFSNNFDFS